MTKVAAVAAKVKQVGKRLDPSHYFVPFLLETPGHLHAINGVATTVTVLEIGRICRRLYNCHVVNDILHVCMHTLNVPNPYFLSLLMCHKYRTFPQLFSQRT